MGQIIKSLASVCACVCRHSYGRSFGPISMKLCIDVWGTKTKIEFVGGYDPITASPIFPYFSFPNVFSMERSKHCPNDTLKPIVAVNNSHYASRQPLGIGY